jgi:DNA gyrase subunit A
MDEYRLQTRGGKGIITMRVTDKTGPVLGVRMVRDDDDLMLITTAGKLIRTPVRGISVIGRNTQGVRLIELEPGEKVVGVATLAEKETDEIAVNGGGNGSAEPTDEPAPSGDGSSEDGSA